MCSNKNLPRDRMSVSEGILPSSVMLHMEVLLRSEAAIPTPELENSVIESETEESSQESDHGDIPEGPTFHLNSKRLNVTCIKWINC